MSSLIPHFELPSFDFEKLDFKLSTLTDLVDDISYAEWAAIAGGVFVAANVVPYLWDAHGMRSYPGPFLAKFTDLWLGRVAALGHRSEVVHGLHEKYGKFVRLAPNHLSISDPDALPVVYGHGTGTLKSNFYDAFVSIQRGLFNTRSRPEHTRKRKIVSHIFSQKSVLEFEPHVRVYVRQLIGQWDRLVEEGVGKERGNGSVEVRGSDGEGGWIAKQGRVWLDCLPWYNYLAFDIIGDLAFGSPFGMLQKCKDAAPVATSQETAMEDFGTKRCDVTYLPAVQIINDRGNFSASMGVLPPYLRPLAKKLPWFNKGQKAVKALAGIAVAAVSDRLRNPSDRMDLLAKLQSARDEEGKPMGPGELTAEALTQLIAGSDTTSNSSCAITYYLAANPASQRKLQAELDEALGSEDDPVATYDQVKRLTYLDAVINEALRLHSTSGIGLPRLVPEGGLEVCGVWFEEGTVLSVPTYSIHRLREVWGEDVEAFRPERWFEEERKEVVNKTFNPFSFGPRSCVGRNLASLELLIIVASILRRYDFVLEHPEPLQTLEGFLRKPTGCVVGFKKRDV